MSHLPASHQGSVVAEPQPVERKEFERSPQVKLHKMISSENTASTTPCGPPIAPHQPFDPSGLLRLLSVGCVCHIVS